MQAKQLDLNAFLAALHQRDSSEMTIILPIVLALVVHLSSQIREPSARPFVGTWTLISAFLTHYIHNEWKISYTSAARTVVQMNAIWIFTLFISMTIYRVLFHRLRHFPAPVWMSLSKWLMVYPDLQGQRPYMFQKLHAKYGDVIRIGPREISVNDSAALSTIYGGNPLAQRCTRGPWYDFTVESTSQRARNLQSTPTMSDHAARRKVWDAAFSIKAIKGYEENIIKNTNLLIEQISKEAEGGKAVNIGQWCTWFGFDVMGELGFGREFDMLKQGKTAHVIHLLESGVILIMATGNVPYIMSLLRDFPNPIRVFEDWILKTLQYRVTEGNKGVVEADVFSYLLGEQKARGGKIGNMRELSADAGLLIVAGSDTSSNAMAVTLFNMLAHHEYYDKVQKEIESVFGNETAEDTLRLWPPVASGLQRVTPKKGMTLPNGQYVPGNIVLSTPTFVMHRDACNFTNPDQFIPERWIDPPQEGEVFNAKAFSAFGYGPTGCIGKLLAWQEMRTVIARFVQTFDAQLHEGFNVEKFKRSIKDCFVMVKDPIPVVVKVCSADFALTS